MKSGIECEDLAPYLREKLLKDIQYTWHNAPYIHEEVRAAIERSEYQRYAPVNYYDPLLLHKMEKQCQAISTADLYTTMICQANINSTSFIHSNYNNAMQNVNIRR